MVTILRHTYFKLTMGGLWPQVHYQFTNVKQYWFQANLSNYLHTNISVINTKKVLLAMTFGNDLKTTCYVLEQRRQVINN